MLKFYIDQYLTYCRKKGLDDNTLKAYGIDLKQFASVVTDSIPPTNEELVGYLTSIIEKSQLSTARRKITSVRSFYSYLEDSGVIEENPFFADKKVRSLTALSAPKYGSHLGIPLNTLQTLFDAVYARKRKAHTTYESKVIKRDIAVIELLFSTGISISELSVLSQADVDLTERTVSIHGRGARERVIVMKDEHVIDAMREYQDAYSRELRESEHWFINRRKKRLSEQSVRDMINRYCEQAGITLHITPKMFRYSFGALHLEQGGDIRELRRILGHAGSCTTEKYEAAVSLINRNESKENK